MGKVNNTLLGTHRAKGKTTKKIKICLETNSHVNTAYPNYGILQNSRGKFVEIDPYIKRKKHLK